MTLRDETRVLNAASGGGEQSLAIRLMEHLIVPTFVLDADGCVLIWNKACERLTGIQAFEVIGTRDHWKAFSAERRPCLADLVATGRYADIETFFGADVGFGLTDFGVSLEATILLPRRGCRFSLAIDAGPIYDESGRLLAVIESFRDITAQKEAQDELQALAARDGLTDLHNRRSFDATLSGELRRCGRDGLPLSLLMIDIDHFKLFNDRFGHLSGDGCIKQVADAIREILRQGDIAARYGGEEFAVVLPGADQEGAKAVAERLRGTVQDLAIAHPDVPSRIVTLSIGAGTSQDPNVLPADLVATADEALYASKRGGRNRVTHGQAQSSNIILF